MRTLASVFPVLVLVMAAAVVSAQPAGDPFRGEASITVVNVPVQVVDRETGEPVRGLSPEDFVIREAGSVQEISNFTELARRMNLKTVAEGIENHDSWDIAKQYGCDICQGYFTGKPMSYDDILDLPWRN